MLIEIKNRCNHLPKEPNHKSYLKYSGLGLQLFITIGIFGWLGYEMDKGWNEGSPLFIIIMIFLGIVGGFYQFFKSVNKE